MNTLKDLESMPFVDCPSWALALSSRLNRDCSVQRRAVVYSPDEARLEFNVFAASPQLSFSFDPRLTKGTHIRVAVDISEVADMLDPSHINPLHKVENDPIFRLTILAHMRRRLIDAEARTLTHYSPK